MIKYFKAWEQKSTVWFLISISFVFFLLRLPSLFEPYWYGDEGIYQVIGKALDHGRLLYRDIWDNKPPLLYILYALFSADQFAIRLFSLIVGLLTTYSFFNLAKVLFTTPLLFPQNNTEQQGSRHMMVVFVTTTFFAVLFGLPLLEGNIANAENFMMLPIIIAALYLFKAKRQLAQLVVPGILLSIAFLFKIVAIFDFAAFTLFLLFASYRGIKNSKQQVLGLLPFFLGFFIPIFLTVLYFAARGALPDFISAVFIQNVGYVNYGNQLIISQGLLLIKLLALAVFTGFLFLKRNLLSKTALFLFLWTSFSLFNAFFSQRPYTHYMLVLLPSFLLFAGFLYALYRIPNALEKTTAKVIRIISLVFFIFILISVIKYFHFYEKNTRYYTNFYQFVAGKKSVTAYQSFFDRNTPKDYAVAQFLKRHANGKTVFLWGDSAQIYVLSNSLPPGRFTVAYHMTSTQKTLRETEKIVQRPVDFIVLSNKKPFPFSLVSYRHTFTVEGQDIYERLY